MEMPILQVYLYRVFWNWAGFLLAVDAAVALLERYLGEAVEHQFHWKPHLPVSLKLGFAVVVLFIAQFGVYRDAQKNLAQAGKDNDGLHIAITNLNKQVVSQEEEITNLKRKPAVVYRTQTIPVPNQNEHEMAIQSKTADIRRKLGELLEEGNKVQARFLATNDAKKELEEGNDWARRVNKYLSDNLDPSYAIQFRNANGSALMGMPTSHSVEGGGYWQNIEGKKNCLNDFIGELRRSKQP